MSYGFLEIDHVLSATTDVVKSGERFERLGFTVTPRSVNETLGVANRHVIMHPFHGGTANFFEWMGVVDQDRATQAAQAMLSGPDGMRTIVLCTSDAKKTFSKLAADGYPFSPPLRMKRDWQLLSGEIVTPEFTVALPIEAALNFNFCEYHNVACYMRDEWLTHTNGAVHLTRVFAIAHDPRMVADYFAKVFGRTAKENGCVFSVSPDVVQLTIGSPDSLRELIPTQWLPKNLSRPSYLGYEVEVRSLAALRLLLTGRGVEFVEHGSALVVAPGEACGNVMRFSQLGSTAPRTR